MSGAQASRIASDRTSLPLALGPLSALILELLESEPGGAERLGDLAASAGPIADAVASPLEDDDLQLALYLCYELHYRSFDGVDPSWEWNPALLGVRAVLEAAFFETLERHVDREQVEPEEVGERLFALEAADQGPSLSRKLEIGADLEQFREFVVHRSLYQLKEADPHSWAISRLAGAPKTALLEVQGDEYGGGRAERMHSILFAKTMHALDLDARENAYLELVPATTLASVNLMSGFGLHRARRGAIVGHLAMFEMTSALPNRRYGNALRRLGFDREVTDFYDEHVEADAVHENIAAYDLAEGLAKSEPELAGDILFGAAAMLFVEDRFARHLLDSWDAGRTSLRRSL
jgi:Iron-containing redox enzyme